MISRHIINIFLDAFGLTSVVSLSSIWCRDIVTPEIYPEKKINGKKQESKKKKYNSEFRPFLVQRFQ